MMIIQLCDLEVVNLETIPLDFEMFTLNLVKIS